MAYCGPRGIPWSRFLSWDRASRDAAILWQQRQQQTCPSCGTHPDDWDPEHGGHPRAWVAKIHHCPGCAALEHGRKRLEKDVDAGDTVSLRRQVPQGGNRGHDQSPGVEV